MSRRRILLLLAGLAALLATAGALWFWRGTSMPDTWIAVDRAPRIWPDYASTVIPPNIAPLNFAVREPGVAYHVRLQGTNGGDIQVASATASIVIPPRAWRTLLEQNRGGRLVIDVYVRQADGIWHRFAAIENVVARENIDSHLVYRLLGAVFVNWGRMGIYQRDLETFDEQAILRNTSVENGCVNCHAFSARSPQDFSLHVRPPSKVLPQQDPLFYDTYLRTYNVPELVRGPVPIEEERLVQAILSAPYRETRDSAATRVAVPN